MELPRNTDVVFNLVKPFTSYTFVATSAYLQHTEVNEKNIISYKKSFLLQGSFKSCVTSYLSDFKCSTENSALFPILLVLLLY